MASKKILTAERLREVLRANPATGEFRWIQHFHKRFIGKIAGGIQPTPSGKPRIIIWVDNKPYKAHRLMWLYVTGKWPSRRIDHIDTDATNNRWNNLRLATVQQNSWNSPKRGARYDKSRGRWLASIRGKHIGVFKTEADAHEAYRKAALEQYGEFAHSSLKLTAQPRRRDS